MKSDPHSLSWMLLCCRARRDLIGEEESSHPSAFSFPGPWRHCKRTLGGQHSQLRPSAGVFNGVSNSARITNLPDVQPRQRLPAHCTMRTQDAIGSPLCGPTRQIGSHISAHHLCPRRAIISNHRVARAWGQVDPDVLNADSRLAIAFHITLITSLSLMGFF